MTHVNKTIVKTIFSKRQIYDYDEINTSIFIYLNKTWHMHNNIDRMRTQMVWTFTSDVKNGSKGDVPPKEGDTCIFSYKLFL